ncbi:glycosyl hydrolase family 114 [Labedella gwakjiensis]|uniref:Glycosyl hydrolase family 114 n=1 Tax=Labedella gwakjiensis TaxID=390269 RepID=A0A2P8GR69_9MICO|nr:endo alpha-1,4 polygalactosaminidase [Labedella gwakjiensis]PSL36458.1 glycosyl hydrolase family 114 [Labedella gwakjiensis]RUQ85618.1 hypothetical protein ELQ93_00815 [Labedella gwakjiensis]
MTVANSDRRRRRGHPGAAVAAAVLLTTVLLAGCGSPESPVDDLSSTHEPDTSATPNAFPVGAGVDYQLGGAYPPPDGVGIVARDSTEQPADGIWSICYVNGFQTQPGESEEWLTDRPDLVVHVDGEPLADPNWPDEYVLDTSTPAKRLAIMGVIGPVIDACSDAGFAAVEIDNLDSFSRSAGQLTAEHNTALAELFAERAHADGLAIGQKNAAEMSEEMRTSVGFDFAVAEECHRFDECRAYTEVYGQSVIDIEYADDLRGSFADVCADPDTPRSVVLRDRDLVSQGDPGYVFELC